ncbi:TPA: mannose-1-phosphate guanylyltransferase/mannose-6-phosphate isomerase, partial [Escherichia coli]|nr:mannose-1-phosphate guanylyltransferase/mannose-6-phosphate isomerase [Escherichia coli]
MLLPVIMAGGVGSRLWPMSRACYPKQFLSFSQKNSMLQDTILRLKGIEHFPVSLICNEEHRFLVAEQLRELNLPCTNIILEPQGRNTAPAVALAALNALEINSESILLVLPADHFIKDSEVFANYIEKALPVAENGKLVTFGISPTRPETGYGYIKKGVEFDASGIAYCVEKFVEKPNECLAKKYLESGKYYWNSGIFMFKASCYMSALKEFRPDIVLTVENVYRSAKSEGAFIYFDEKDFSACPSESIDYAVMEKTKEAVMIPMDVGWNDMGSWGALWDINQKDENGNVILGDALIEDSHNCYINSSDRLISAIGISNLAIVDTKDAILITHRGKTQNVKNIVSRLKENNRCEYLYGQRVYKKWGEEEYIVNGLGIKIKKLGINPDCKILIHSDEFYDKHILVIAGTFMLTLETERNIMLEHGYLYMPEGGEK